MKHGGFRKGAGRKARPIPKSKGIWCGQISNEVRKFIIDSLSPDDRYKVLMVAANTCVQADGDAPRCEGCGGVLILFSRYCHVCGRPRR